MTVIVVGQETIAAAFVEKNNPALCEDSEKRHDGKPWVDATL